MQERERVGKCLGLGKVFPSFGIFPMVKVVVAEHTVHLSFMTSSIQTYFHPKKLPIGDMYPPLFSGKQITHFDFTGSYKMKSVLNNYPGVSYICLGVKLMSKLHKNYTGRKTKYLKIHKERVW